MTTRTSLSSVSSGVAAAVFGLGVFVSAPSANAVEIEYDGSKVRIALAADLRSLGERTMAAACRAARDPGHRAAFVALTQEFDAILSALRSGDADYAVPGPEESGRIHARFDALEGRWMELDAALVDLAAGALDPSAAAPIAAAQGAFIEEAEMLLADMAGRYSNPQEVLKTDAMRTKFLKRQRKLLDRMDRVVCCMAAGFDALGSPELLAETIALFDASLLALRDGMPAAGVSEPRHPPVADRLSSAYDVWSARRGPLDAVAGGADPADAVSAAAALAKTLSAEMHNAATLAKVLAPGRTKALEGPIKAYADTKLAMLSRDPKLVAAIAAQNEAHADLTDDEVAKLDAAWQAGTDEGKALIADVDARPLSGWLAETLAGSGGFLTEIIAMDARGLNAALSAPTSDYWQGDEDKWQETVRKSDVTMHIGQVDYDDSTGLYQVEASFPVRDAAGAPIGAIAFAFDVGRLF